VAWGSMQTSTRPDDFFAALPADVLMDPAGHPPEFLRGLLRTPTLRGMFAPDSTARGNLEIVRAAAYRSVELALSLGITVSLFTDPVRRFAPELWREQLEAGFLSAGWLGGMMITEPGCGTDLMACQTEYRVDEQGPLLAGTKHWAGLTGLADYWLVLARDGEKGRGFGFPSLNFYVCRATPESFQLLKRYGPAGLRSIPYGMTRIEAREGILAPLLSGSKTDRFRQIHSILHRSRISISAIACGACARLADDVRQRVRERTVFGKPLDSYGQVQVRVAEIEAAREISRVLHEIGCREAEAADRPGSAGVPAQIANVVKVVASDLAFAAATSASQLFGGESCRTDGYVGRATADLRPFRIFEGSNDVLCDAIWQAAEKAAKTGGESFADAVRGAHELAGWPAPAVSAFAAEAADGALPQGLRCLGGRVLANAEALRRGLEHGLASAVLLPLRRRIARDLAFAEADRSAAGLVEY
ncbi:MAG: acyl-CoA dehydrogenase family protein, partial [Kiritimatiellia bacterium]